MTGKFIIMFNNAGAINKMPKTRRNWENQLLDDFLKAIHRMQYECDSKDALLERLRFIAGKNAPLKFYADPENFVTVGEGRDYGERKMSVSMYGFAQGHLNLNSVLAPILPLGDLVDTGEIRRATVIIPFKSFYDGRQNTKQLSGCYVEVHRVA